MKLITATLMFCFESIRYLFGGSESKYIHRRTQAFMALHKYEQPSQPGGDE